MIPGRRSEWRLATTLLLWVVFCVAFSILVFIWLLGLLPIVAALAVVLLSRDRNRIVMTPVVNAAPH